MATVNEGVQKLRGQKRIEMRYRTQLCSDVRFAPTADEPDAALLISS